jgi:glutathione S-transferase
MGLLPLRFLTMPISHYCEKVRWALDRQRLPYREEAHAPLFHMLAALPATGFRSRTVPVLIDENPGQAHVLDDSTAILRYLERRYGASWLFAAPEAEALEEEFDKQLGPHARRVFYFHMLPFKGRLAELFASAVPRHEATIIKAGFSLLLPMMRRGMRISEESARRSLERVEGVFERTSQRLGDGRRYLGGDTFGAADLTFAALASPLLLPPEYGIVPMPQLGELPPALVALVQRFRATPAGQFALRLFAEDRRPV